MPRMSTLRAGSLAFLLCTALLAAGPARAQDKEAVGFERTPPRLSLTDGDVSFWRPGAEDWVAARVNTPLAAGDELYAATGANLELQIGARAYVRAGEETQLGLTQLEPDYLQLRVTSGTVSLDLRSRSAGQTFEIASPNAAFTVERTGYYRVEVHGDATTFTSRRGGRATVTSSDGAAAAIGSSEQVVVSGAERPRVESYAAPELDAWDRWNYTRTDEQLEAVSVRYVSPGVYGVADLDHHGDWRLVSRYGAVWVPRGVAAGWVPYSTGRWIYDPFYGWTWIDDALWGWAPYHYGRWVYVSGFWGWCPGPVVVRSYYAPALVAFYGGGGFSFGITIGRPRVGWVALGWGEPIVPWWGPVGFRGYPYWAGWGGPRVVNKVVIKRTQVIRAREIKVYENAGVHDAIVTAPRGRFGRRDREGTRFARAEAEKLEPLRGDLPMKPDRSSLVPTLGRAVKPPRETLERPVVATRPPRVEAVPGFERAERKDVAPPPARVVERPREARDRPAPERPPFGRQGDSERHIPPPVPRYEELRRGQSAVTHAQRAPAPSPAPPREAPNVPRPSIPRERAPAPEAPSVGRGVTPPAARTLPGEPANRVWRPRAQRPGGDVRPGSRQEPRAGGKRSP